MVAIERTVAGREYLTLVTELLQRARRADPTGGVWEAADLQWWWRRDQHPDASRQTFWLEGGVPVAAVVLTDWTDRIGCDVLAGGHVGSGVLEMVRPRLVEVIGSVGSAPVEMVVREDDDALTDAMTATGFEPTDEVGVTTSMDAADRPGVPALPAGFSLRARSETLTRPHPMIGRNGEHVADRLEECSLYRRDHDLAIYDPGGDVAAYGLFWADPVTGVGLVEPMRTEDRHQGRGLGRCLLAAGLERLARHGCARLKVTYLVGNEASRRLYLGAGFAPGPSSRTYRLVPGGLGVE